MATLKAQQLIDLSIREDRVVTEYPDTQQEYNTLLDDLLAIGDDVDYTEVSGSGYSGPEERGYTDVWGTDGDDWRVSLIHPLADDANLQALRRRQ
jgi:hypothetical protein